MNELHTLDFFRDPALIDDPNPYYHAMRSKCPVLREQHHGVMMVTGYQEALEVLANRKEEFSSCVAVTGPIPPLPFKPEGDDMTAQIKEHFPELPWSALLVSYDGKEHQAIRTILTSLLTHTRLKKNEEYMRMLAGRLIDKFIDRGKCEFITEYAHALSTLVIADLLGVPEADREELLVLIGPDPTNIEGDPMEKISPDPLPGLEPLFSRYLKERRGKPGDDMMSQLANATFKDGTLPDIAIVIRLAKFLFTAGQDTSARLMAASFKFLCEYPDIQQRLRKERDKIPDFVEETLRFDAPVKVLSRVAKRNTTIGETPVPIGSIVTVGLSAATRDPKQFENPDEFNIDRPNTRDNLAFSRGPHACPGAPLARAEARITLELMLDRTKDIRISEKEHGPPNARRYKYQPTFLLRGLRALHLEFDRT